MSKKQDKRLIAGMDIGTSKIVTLVGEVTPEGHSKSSAWARTRRADSRRAWW